MRGKAILGFAAVVGITAGMTGCSGGIGKVESPRTLHKELSSVVECDDPDFESGHDEGTGIPLTLFECDSSLFGIVFKSDDLFETDREQAVVDYLGISSPEDWWVLTGDNWSVWYSSNAKGADEEAMELHKALGGEIREPEQD